MVKITDDHTAASIQKSAAEKHNGRLNGFDEQWLRALERDHMEQQMSKMRRTPFCTSPAAAVEVPESPTAASHPVRALPDRCQIQACAADPVMPSTVGNIGGKMHHSGVCPKAGHGFGQDLRTGACSHALPLQEISDIAGKPAPERSSPVWSHLKRLLPPSSSVSIFIVDEGVHVVIRETTLQPDDLKRILGRIRSLFASLNQRLAAVTLNGQRLWKRRSDARLAVPSDNTQIMQRIDKLY